MSKMNDKELLKLIESAAPQPPELDFQDVMKRLEKLDVSEQQEPEAAKECAEPVKQRPVGRVSFMSGKAGLAAAALVALLGAGLILGGILSANGKMQSEAGMNEFAPEAYTDENNYSAEEVEDAYQPSGALVSTEYADETSPTDLPEEQPEKQPDSLTEKETQEGYSIVDDNGAMTGYYIERPGITILLPARAYVTGENVAEDFPLLEEYSITAEQLEANYAAGNIRFNALWYDDYADITEIVVTSVKDDASEEIFNLGEAEDYELRLLENGYLFYTGGGDDASYEAATTVEHPQTCFIKAKGTKRGKDTQSNHLQYMTVVNGQRVQITLIEHFGISSELTDSTPTEISPKHEKMMDDIISSVKWKHVRSYFIAKNRSAIFYGGLTCVSLFALIWLFELERRKKKESNDCAAETLQSENELLDGAAEPPLEKPQAEKTSPRYVQPETEQDGEETKDSNA